MSHSRLHPFAFASTAIALAISASASTAQPTTPPATPTGAASPAAPTATPAIDPAIIQAIVDERLAEQPSISWKDGFNLATKDNAFKLKIGGYTQFDGRYFVDDDAEQNSDQFAFRRIRPELAGTLLDRAEFRLLPDFAGSKVVVQDAYVEVKAANPIKLRFGKFKEPLGLERLQSATALLFVERGLPTALAPNRDLGIQLGGAVAKERVAYQLGVFNGVADGASGDGDASDDKELVARVFLTPFAPNKGNALEFLGIGGAVSYGDKHGTTAATDLPALKTSGQATFFQYRTGATAAETALADGNHWRVTGQAHVYSGRFGALAEYIHSSQDVALGDAVTEVSSDAWQLALNAVVFGGTASFKGTSPTEAFSPKDHHWGAFELAARYNELRVGDEAFTFAVDPAKSANLARSFGFGANWILGRSLRFVANLERTSFEGGAAMSLNRPTETAILGRVQTVF
jgi:phosphate-selective porin OprO and OprP